jgi:uncharacterized repeat protein (TIGR03803 family)
MFRKLFLPALIVLVSLAAQGQNQFQVLHAFGSGSDGGGLWSSVVFDKQGNLYGATSGGGDYGYGTVFELSPASGGQWTETVLHSFENGDPDGDEPNGGVVFDAAGNLYETTGTGGVHQGGTLFEMMPGLSGWGLNVLYSFCSRPQCSDGGFPWAGPLMDKAGNLYGTAHNAFEFSPGPDGGVETVLHDFTGQNGDGDGAAAGVIMDNAGNLYGTTINGGGLGGCIPLGCGTAYRLSPVRVAAEGLWTERILYRFGSFMGDGEIPSLGQLTMDRRGSLYGATHIGGTAGYGTVFRLTDVPVTPGGVWVETILYNFTSAAYGPGGGVTFDRAGNLYGTTIYGGGTGCGVVYELSPVQGGKWQYTLLHSFLGSDGCQPDANLTLGPDGNLYGTTATGGAGGAGVVFEIQLTR